MPTHSIATIQQGESALSETLSHAPSHDRLVAAASAVEDLERFVRSYERIDEDVGLSSDDEILNWVFDECLHDLNAAVWNCASGHYKTAATALRGALEISVIALYFQNLENDHTSITGSGFNPDFLKWDRGDADTPSWKTPKAYLRKRVSFVSVLSATGHDVVQLAHDHYGMLCSFTHSRPKDFAFGGHTNTTWMMGVSPRHESKILVKVLDVLLDTISWIVTLWLVSFPQILKSSANGGGNPLAIATALVRGVESKAALNHCKKLSHITVS